MSMIFEDACRSNLGFQLNEIRFISSNQDVIRTHIKRTKQYDYAVLIEGELKVSENLSDTFSNLVEGVQRKLKTKILAEFVDSDIEFIESEVAIGYTSRELVFRQYFIHSEPDISFEEKASDLVATLAASPITDENFLYLKKEKQLVVKLANYEISWDVSELSNVVNIGTSLRKLRKLNTIRELIARIKMLMKEDR